MNEHQAPEFAAPDDELLQDQAPDLTAIPVRVEGAVQAVTLPTTGLMVGQVAVDSTGGVVQPLRLLGGDPRRARVQIVATGGPVRVGTSQKQVANSTTCAVWPAGVPLELRAVSEVWIAADAAPATVSYVAELWTD